jgi:cellulose synthase operon protein C
VIGQYPRSQQHADALLAAARLHDKLKQPQPAAAFYERLEREHPQFPKLDVVLYDWAWALRALNKPEDADRLFERLRKQYPQSRFRADATYRLAQRAYDAKDFPRAGGLIDDALAANADPQVREYVMHLRGQIAVAKADWPNVREVFEALVKEFSESRRRLVAEYWIAEACYRQADYKAAAERLERLAHEIKDPREPWMAMVPLRRAQMLVKQGQYHDAYAIAVQIETDYPRFEQQYEVDYVLGRCLANQADFDAARKAYNRVIGSAAGAKTETAAMAQWMIGETYFHQKDYRAALREYLRLETLYAFPDWQAAALLEAGKCHQRLGEPTPAADLYRQILKDYPKTSFAQQAAKQLSATRKKTP